MAIDWSQPSPRQDDLPARIKAARYVRMSTEHQRYSTENQGEAIDRYALARGYEIVRDYADEGKSGLTLDGRDALKRLLDDVENGRADFAVVLVYDVSRWGRFQDPDEAASYELRCRRAGIAVHYCAEQFENDGSMGAAIIKTVKRAMAGEYSRELSVKVHAGQKRLIELGFRQGAAPGYGLRRMLVDERGNPKGELARGEHKSIQTDRVILVPGPADEREVVRQIYEAFCSGLREAEIAAALNDQGVPAEAGRPWSRGVVHQILINEKYIGNNVWNRSSFKLKTKFVRNPPELWARADGVYEPVVRRELFEQARAIIEARTLKITSQEMLAMLSQLLERKGFLSGLVIDECEDCPSTSAFRSRFGSLLTAYTLVGYTPDRDFRYVEVNRELRRMHPEIVKEVIDGITRAGGRVAQDPKTDILRINDEFTASIVITRCSETSNGASRWKIRLDTGLKPDLTIAARMDPSNRHLHDFYILPRMDMHEAVLRLADHNGLSFDAYRFESLDALFTLAERVRLAVAA